MTSSDEQIRGAIAQQAAEWFIAHQSGSLDEEETAAFLAWLKTSPVHVREYLGVARVARHLPAAAGEPEMPLEAFLAQATPASERMVTLRRTATAKWSSGSRQSWRRGWAIAASVLALAAGALWWAHDGELLGIPKTYRTWHGEQLVERLPDGSILRLDTDSEATVRYSARERLLQLRRGQALFEVAHETERRFRVAAGDAGAIATGTQFNVYRKESSTEFTVVRGEVAVFVGEPSWLRISSGVPPEAQRLETGYQIRMTAGAFAPPVAVDLDETLGWVQHKIVFEHRPLGDVTAEFNRYAKIPVAIEDEELRALPVTGMFDAGDTESFVEFLQTLPGVRVDRTPARITITRIRTTT